MRGVRDLHHEAASDSVSPARDAGVALVLPAVSAAAIQLTPLLLPASSPELNPIERAWLYLRERFLSPRLWPSYDAILDARCTAWNALINKTGRIRSLRTLDWATSVSP